MSTSMPEQHRPTHADLFGTTSAPCPPWCVLPTGHGYESADDLGEYRSHQLEIGAVDLRGGRGHDVAVYLEAYESHVGQAVTVAAPLIGLDAHGVELTAGQARALAAVLLSAAARCDEATA